MRRIARTIKHLHNAPWLGAILTGLGGVVPQGIGEVLGGVEISLVDSLIVSISTALILCIFSPRQSFTRCTTYTPAKTLR